MKRSRFPDTSISGKRVARELTAVIEGRGKPQMIVSDHGTEFTSNAILSWTEEQRVEWHYIAPGNPSGVHLGVPASRNLFQREFQADPAVSPECDTFSTPP